MRTQGPNALMAGERRVAALAADAGAGEVLVHDKSGQISDRVNIGTRGI